MELDDLHRDLIDLLQQDGRMSYRELGDRVGLTAPAVAERVRKLEDAGIITGYRAVVDYEALGFPILCVVRLSAPKRAAAIDDKIRAEPQIIEANRVTGEDSHVIRARLRSMRELEVLLDDILEDGDSITNIVTSSPVPARPMDLRVAGLSPQAGQHPESPPDRATQERARASARRKR